MLYGKCRAAGKGNPLKSSILGAEGDSGLEEAAQPGEAVEMKKAFVLGAGLGTRLRPLTDQLPKPLIPVHHRPLIVRAFQHLRAAGVEEFAVNTHHLPECYERAFPGARWEGCRLHFRHEPVLLETGGGLAQMADLLQDEPFLVYNGDILTDISLEEAMAAHQVEGNLVTLLLRSDVPVRNVAFDAASGRVLDLRNGLATNHPDQRGFTGLYVVSPAFFRYLVPGKVESVVAALLRAVAAGERIGGVLGDVGHWFDLGDRASYLAAHAAGSRDRAGACGGAGGPHGFGGCGLLGGAGRDRGGGGGATGNCGLARRAGGRGGPPARLHRARGQRRRGPPGGRRLLTRIALARAALWVLTTPCPWIPPRCPFSMSGPS